MHISIEMVLFKVQVVEIRNVRFPVFRINKRESCDPPFTIENATEWEPGD